MELGITNNGKKAAGAVAVMGTVWIMLVVSLVEA